jgi:hypothetical protein
VKFYPNFKYFDGFSRWGVIWNLATLSGPVPLSSGQNGGVVATPGTSSSSSNLNEIRNFLGRPLISPVDEEDYYTISGWTYSKHGDSPTLTCLSADNKREKIDYQNSKSEDVASALGDIRAINNRYQLKITKKSECKFTFFSKDKHYDIYLNGVSNGAIISADNNNIVQVDSVIGNIDNAGKDAYKYKASLIKLYSYFLPLCYLLGFLAFFLNTFNIIFKGGEVDLMRIYFLAFGILAFAICRLLILTYVDFTAFIGYVPLYFMAIPSLLTTFCIINLYIFNKRIFYSYKLGHKK